MSNERKVQGIYRGSDFHWVGDGFRVSNYFPSGNDFAQKISPYVMFDYAAPYDYTPSDRPRGVGTHPHRGFETVTISFEGSLAHHDSAGHAGVIGPGDVQWMTAASGVLHKEYHEAEFSRRGGRMHMAQIWVNLPASHKMDKPRYQGISDSQIGRAVLPNGSGEVRVIAGEYNGVKGPASTVTPINMFEIQLNPNGRVPLSFPATQNTALMVLGGDVVVNGKTKAAASDFVLFENRGEDIEVQATTNARLLLLNGDPIDEPVVHYGPFVMNTPQEIRQAIADFNSGKFGHLDD
jgi:quercetin 2,3-dioxygenase